MKIAVIRLPGSNCDLDVLDALKKSIGVDAKLVWHEESDLTGYQGVVLPGGFAYGDYLRAGAIAAHSPIMDDVRRMARFGRPVLGICNGFQILTEAGLLPGALLRNSSLRFVCRWVNLRVESDRSLFTKLAPKDSILKMPVAHNEGRYFASEEQLRELGRSDRIILRYVDDSGLVTERANPNGSIDNIAAVCNEEGNVMGLMPHPERACDKLLSPFGTNHGRLILEAMVLGAIQH